MTTIADTLQDILSPDDCPKGEVTVRRGLIRTIPGDVRDCVIAYRPDALRTMPMLCVVTREAEGGPWSISVGTLAYDELLDALEPHTGTRDY